MAPRRDVIGPATVLETRDPGLLAVAKSLLDAAGIPFHADGEALSIAWGGGPVKLQVPGSRAAEAQALLDDLQQPRRARILKFPPPSS